jgi:hypothetical protein
VHSGDRCDLTDLTSCFSQWRAQEAEWESLHKKQVEEEMEIARLKEVAIREKRLSTDQPPPEDSTSTATGEAANPAATIDNSATAGAEPGLVRDASIKLPPEDCLAVDQIEVNLVCGRGEVETGRLLVPANTPPGRYVLEIIDGVLPACLRNEDSGITAKTTATLEDTRFMSQLVRRVKSNHQIVFTVVDPNVALPPT